MGMQVHWVRAISASVSPRAEFCRGVLARRLHLNSDSHILLHINTTTAVLSLQDSDYEETYWWKSSWYKKSHLLAEDVPFHWQLKPQRSGAGLDGGDGGFWKSSGETSGTIYLLKKCSFYIYKLFTNSPKKLITTPFNKLHSSWMKEFSSWIERHFLFPLCSWMYYIFSSSYLRGILNVGHTVGAKIA